MTPPPGPAALLKAPGAGRVLALLSSGGEEARIVGGAVRNALLSRAVTDIDIATTALPGEILARAKKAGMRAIPTGIKHGTVTLLAGGASFEVTTLREDIETDGRHAKVRFGRDFRADALRRDFTVNALSLDTEGRVHDYTGGLEDLAARKIRFIGDARQRIREDYLRIPRLFRFHAQYGAGPLDRAALEASIAGRAGLAHLSRERIRAEIFKLLGGANAAGACRDMSDAGLLGLLLGGAPNPARLARTIEVEAARKSPADALLRLAALRVLIDEDVAHLRDALRLTNEEQAHLRKVTLALGQWHGRGAAPADDELRVFLFLIGRAGTLDAASLIHAAGGAPPDDETWRAAYDFLRKAPEPKLPFGGAEIISRGITAGPAIGRVLKTLQAQWIRAGFPKDPAQLAKLLEEAVAEGK